MSGQQRTRITMTYRLGDAEQASVTEAFCEVTTDLMHRLLALGVEPVGNVHTEVEDAT